MFAGVGERTREGNDLYREMIESVSRGSRDGRGWWWDDRIRVGNGGVTGGWLDNCIQSVRK